jgi:anti-anti-sigma regulatory factor
MFTIEVEQSRNLLVIRYSDHVGPDETERALEEMRLALDQVERGFRLLADLTQLQSMDIACAPHIESAMEMCNGKGVAEVIRIIPDPRRDIGMQIMSRFHYSGDVRIATCESADEAMTFLAN